MQIETESTRIAEFLVVLILFRNGVVAMMVLFGHGLPGEMGPDSFG